MKAEEKERQLVTKMAPCWAHREVAATVAKKLEEVKHRDWSRDEIRIR